MKEEGSVGSASEKGSDEYIKYIERFFSQRGLTGETTIESSPEEAARLIRALKAQEPIEKKTDEEPNWFEVSREEVREKLGKDTIWNEPPVARGRAFEVLRSANLGSNYPVVDDIRIDAGTAASMKTLDLSSGPYQNVETIDSTVRGYINKLNSFTGFKWNNQEYRRGKQFQDLYLELGIPAGKASPAQISKLFELQEFAESSDVTLVIVKVP